MVVPMTEKPRWAAASLLSLALELPIWSVKDVERNYEIPCGNGVTICFVGCGGRRHYERPTVQAAAL